VPRKHFRKFLPDGDTVRGHKYLAWLGTWLRHPNLWHLNRHSVAGGVAIGMFSGLVPGPFQMLTAAILCVVLKVNLPVALFTTLYTNPFTIGPLYLVAYQIGALQAMAAYVGEKVTHLKPHGALNNMAAENADYAMAIGRAIKAVDRNIIYVTNVGSEMEKAGRKLGLKVAREAYCDRLYDDDCNLTSRKIPGAVIHDPAVAAERVVHMVVNGEIISRTGKRIPQHIDTLCVHGDEPTAIVLASAVRAALEAAGVKIVPLPEMALG